jgi:hypothetical protein
MFRALVFEGQQRGHKRRGDPAATNAPRKNLILPQEKIAHNALPSVCRKTRTCS